MKLRKVKLQGAQNALEQLDAGTFRRSLEDVAKRLEDRRPGPFFRRFRGF